MNQTDYAFMRNTRSLEAYLIVRYRKLHPWLAP